MRLTIASTAFILAATVRAEPPNHANLATNFPAVKEIAEGIVWPLGQILPTFAAPAQTLDAVSIRDLTPDERLTFSALQGQVNRKQPRIFLMDPRAEEGANTWPDTATIKLGPRKVLAKENRLQLITRYAAEIEGVVLYDPSRSAHYRNLAGSIAGPKHALPMTKEIYDQLSQSGTKLDVLLDLTKLQFTSALQIYQHLYENYWADCEKRVILSANPDSRGDLHHTRDIASAVGTAIIWLDGRIPAEREMMRRFYSEMKAGEGIALGWYPTERSGITTASEFGIGTMPSDFFTNASVYSGSNHRIQIPTVPKSPKLENKTYVALFISDGDNIQYTQHAMRRVWDSQKEHRGKTALNWTIAPGLVDIAPGILNYYYSTATPLDAFATGPSGLGYLMPSNTLAEPGAPVGVYTKSPQRMDGYAQITETYLQRSGLRVMTIWDDASPMQRASYTTNCRSLYGATVQNFKDVPSVKGSVEAERLPFDKLTIPYASSYRHLEKSLRSQIQNRPANSPRFLSYQVNIWKELKPNRINELASILQKDFPGEVEFVRADHYFNLSNEAHGLPFNLVMSKSTTIAPCESSQLIDGSPSTSWNSAEGSAKPIIIDLHEPAKIQRYRIQRTRATDQKETALLIEASLDQIHWQVIDQKDSHGEILFDVEFPPVSARYLRITFETASPPLSEIEIFGSRR
ncbi:discoidin domain-containing protein [Verrucomicrobiaceae bacterium 227]